jgi:hypothetical protein
MPATDRLPARIAIPIILGVSLSGWALFAAFLVARAMTADTNILKFTAGETDEFGLPPESPGYRSRALLADLRREPRRTLLLSSGLTLMTVVAFGIGAAFVWSHHPSAQSERPVTEIAAHPVQEAPAALQAQPRAWWAARGPQIRKYRRIRRFF